MEYNAELFKQWILEQKGNYTISQSEKGNTLILDTEFAQAHVNFHFEDITELAITSKETGDNVFYLHFQARDKDHSQELFREMVDTLVSIKKEHVIKVMLTCSSALTTSYFAELLNEAAKKMEVNYEFNAVAYPQLLEKVKDSEIILLAPQIYFEYKKIQAAFPDKIVLKMPANIFGAYKATEMINVLNDTIRKHNDALVNKSEPVTIREVHSNDKKILTIAFITNKRGTRLSYRVYEMGQIMVDRLIIKEEFSEGDLDDLISTVISAIPDLDAINIAIPGVAFNELISNDSQPDTFELARKYREKFNKPVFLCNLANGMALGYRALHDNCDNMVFLYQGESPDITNGGLIVNGKLITGHKSYAGEIATLVRKLIPNHDEMRKTLEGSAELIAAEIFTYICTVAPEKVVVYSSSTADMDSIRSKLSEVISKQNLPEITYAEGVKRYVMPGLMIDALERLKDYNKSEK